ncbi:Rib/alpha-like domain-containing protein [Streptococcus agalactiae]|nr:Rib/alpha-like domain-containing protein [Streptococcus agalactiae]
MKTLRLNKKESLQNTRYQHGVGSHIAETVITTVDKNGNYSIPFKGLYGVSAYKANSGLKVSHTITDEEFGKVVRDEDVDNSSLLKWNGTIGQKHRHINENYLYVSPILSNYNIWSPAFPKAMFGNPSNLFTNVVAGSGTNITSLNFAILAPQPMLDIVDYDTTNKVAVSGNVTNSTVGGLLPTREYQVQWFRDGVAIGEPQTIQSSVEGTATPEKFTVPNDITKTTNFTLGLFEQGQNTKSLDNALALDSFIAVFIEYKPVDGVVAKDSEPAKPIFKDKDGNDTTPPEGTKFTTVAGQVPDSVKTSYPEGAMSVDPNMVTIDPTTGVVVVKGEALTKKGTYVVPVEVTYPGGSKAYTFATVNVKDDATTTYTATGGKLEKPFGQAPSTDEITSKVTTDYPKEVKDQPTMKVKEGAVIPDGMTKGEFKVPVVVTYPDGSTDTVDVTVKVVDPRKDADKNEPKAKDQTVNIGETPKAEDSIENLKDLPAGTKVEFKTPIDTTTAGDKPGKVVVTYPDGSTDTVDVTVKVVDPRKDADKNEPKAKDQTVNIGETPKAEDSIENLKDLPAGTKVEFKTPIDTTTAGDKPGKVVVTYPDGSTDTVDVTVKVVDPRKDADKNEPKAKDQTVNIGETPKAEDSIENLKDLPAGTKVEFKTPIDTTTAGDKPGKVVVTYPDGSTDTVDVTVKVVDPRKDADKNEPKAKDQTVNIGETPKAEDSIENLKDLPAGTKVEFKTPIDTTTAGDKPGKVVVTYPDGSTDTVDVTVKVVDPRKDADKNEPKAKDQTVNIGETPKAEDSIENLKDLPAGTKVEFKTPIDTTTAGDKPGKVVVTYPDGSTDTVDVTVKVVDPRKDADKNEPKAKDQTVNIGETPKAEDSIENLKDLPAGTKVEFKTPIDTTTAGDKPGKVVVTYPDGSTDTVDVTVKVVDPRKDADKNEPKAKDQTVNIGETPKAEDSIENLKDLPAGTKVEFKTPIDTTTAGDKPGKVVVTYPDGSTDTVDVTVKVVDPRKDADKNEPKAKDQTVNIGETPKAEDSIENLKDLPAGTKVEFKTPIDTTTAGDKPGKVVVTYPDGSTDTVDVTVKVVDPRKDADKNEPKAKDQTVNIGETPKAEDSIENLKDLPAGTKVEFKTPIDTTTAGDKPGKVVVTYPDGSTDTVDVTVKVVDPRKDADKNEPKAKDQTVNIGETPKAEDSIENLKDLPAGTKVEFKTPIDTTTAGDKPGKVVVTYPDGSTDTVDVTVKVVDPRKDADKNEPKAKDQTVNIGETPKAEDSIENLKDLPAGTKVEFKTPIDTTTAGDKPGKVVVTYPDGSTDTVDVTVKVVDPRKDADKNEPKAKDQTVNIGETPKAEDSIENLKDLPAGTKVEFKTPIDTTTAGDKPGKVVVTYPDGSTDTVDVTVKVVDPRKDADKNEPKAKDQTVNIGETPKAEDSIENLKDLPAGTKVEFKTPIDTTTAGDKPGKVVVTYPDGSTDTVDVTVKVVDPRKDADKNEPKAKDQTVNIGETPKAEDSIENLKDLPAGTKVEFKTPIDTTTAGDKPGKVVVTYPDGSTDTVDVTVKVVDPRKDADKNEPKAKDQTVNIGETPKAEDSIENLKDLPAGTKVEFKTPIDTTTAGDKPGKVVVTYPDGSTDTVDVTVKVVDPRKDADKNEPKAKDQTVNIGETPKAEDSIENLKDLPAGTKVEFKTPIDTTTAGDKPGKVVVTYPDGSTDTVDVTVKVVDPRKDADKNEPKAKDQTQALSSIANNKDRGNKLPTTGEDENPFFNIAALTIIASVGLLSNLKKKED